MAVAALCRSLPNLIQKERGIIGKGVLWQLSLRCTCSLVLADRTPADLTCIAAAQQFKLPVDLVVAGPVEEGLLSRYRHTVGVRRVLRCTDSLLAHLPADATASLLVHLNKTEKPSYICATSSSVGKDVLPRVGGLLDVQPVTDVVEGAEVFVRPVYAGKALQTLRVRENPKVLTFRAAAFAPAPSSPDLLCPVEEILFQPNTQVVRPQPLRFRVIAAGRGIRTKADFERLLEPLRKKLGAAVGATRAVVDLGFVPSDSQVGQTGKVIAPDLYIAVGLSGAIQHVAGMRSAKVIVAVNKDPDAPIFQVSSGASSPPLLRLA
ncbi:hypothetical protein Esti_001382 [Eimeria stiedai]